MKPVAANYPVNKLILKHSLPTNEGHATLLCGNMIAHIVDEININNEDSSLHQFEVFPIVKKEADARNNKLADYTIYKIYNKRTHVVVEVKLDVPDRLSAATQDNLAQLFLEAVYCSSQKEKGDSKMMCILTNGLVWQ